MGLKQSTYTNCMEVELLNMLHIKVSLNISSSKQNNFAIITLITNPTNTHTNFTIFLT